MSESEQIERQAYKFIMEQIDSVPHLEALLLLWTTRPASWSAAELAARLYVDRELARNLLEDLNREALIALVPGATGQYHYPMNSDRQELDNLIESVDKTYRREIVRISTMIHSKAPIAVRDFARAFRFTKEKS